MDDNYEPNYDADVDDGVYPEEELAEQYAEDPAVAIMHEGDFSYP